MQAQNYLFGITYRIPLYKKTLLVTITLKNIVQEYLSSWSSYSFSFSSNNGNHKLESITDQTTLNIKHFDM